MRQVGLECIVAQLDGEPLWQSDAVLNLQQVNSMVALDNSGYHQLQGSNSGPLW